jgi:purine nucleosidase
MYGEKSMNFPTMSDSKRLERLRPPTEKIRMVLDTDTFNEIDDQFAVVYALLSPMKLNVEAIYAAPFHNTRSSGPGDGMEKSFKEILKLLNKIDISPDRFVFRGSTDYLKDINNPQRSKAVMDLVNRAMKAEKDPLYVVAIGAITNVVSSILVEPRILERIVVIWLGGQPFYWANNEGAFNLVQDLNASRLIFDCGVPLVHIPMYSVSSHLLTNLLEIQRYVKGQGDIGDYLATIFREFRADHFAYSKVIWDISAIAYLINNQWVETEIVHSPILTNQMTWSIDRSRHFIRNATVVRRDPIFRDFFTKLKRDE